MRVSVLRLSATASALAFATAFAAPAFAQAGVPAQPQGSACLAPAGTRGQVGAADLNTLPSAIVDRFEILETGASSVYGSDAIAGVINIVTRNKINGLQLEAQADLPQVGAGSSYRVSAVGGFHAGAFNVIGSLEYFRRNELTFGDESWARCQTDLRLTGVGATPGSAD